MPRPTERREKKEESGRGGDRHRPTRRKICKFCAEKVSAIDYQDTTRLVKFVSERGKILPRRVSGNCARHQRQMSRAIQRARAVALMPYVAD
ncbi:MAG: 30S ribosomal protein S18 [Candidatus Omnitrophica bacterium]|nr:30S ribosomal protein S18 [Candidatus Omnitrophota bacterium]